MMTIREEKEIEGIQIDNEVKFSLFADNMILYIENSKDAIKKLLELISEFSNVSGYKINTQNSLAFLYSNNKKSEKLRNQFIIATERIKYLGINLPKKTKDLYTQNYDIDERNQRQHNQMERYTMFLDWKNIVKMTILPKAIHRFSAVLIKLPMAFFTEQDQKDLIFV